MFKILSQINQINNIIVNFILPKIKRNLKKIMLTHEIKNYKH